MCTRETRERLPSVLERFRQGDRTPVGVGSHRKTEAVMIPVEVFEELTAERASAAAEAAASVHAEGLEIDDEAVSIAARWTRGELSTEQMREMIRRRYTAP